MVFKSILIIVISFFGLQTFAQETDSVLPKADTIKQIKADTVKQAAKVKTKQKDSPPKDSARLALEAMPRKAIIRSLILPGLGQYHNKGLWYLKVPAIYAGLIAFGIAIKNNHDQYEIFLKEAKYRQEHNDEPLNPRYAGFQLPGIIAIKDGYKRNQILSIFGFIGVYGVNVIDAYVTAKFFRYDISEDLSLRLQPSILKPTTYTNAYTLPVPAIKITLSL